MSKKMSNKNLMGVWVCLVAIIIIPLSAYGEEWKIASGGMSNDDQSIGTFLGSGTGVVTPTPSAWANVTATITGTGNAGYISGESIVKPKITLNASESVDLYISVILGNLVLYYNPCTSPFENPWSNYPIQCYTSGTEIALFEFPARILADIMPEFQFVPFGIFVRAVKAGTGKNGQVLNDAQATTYLNSNIVFPEPPVAPW